jgi:plastocyanin
MKRFCVILAALAGLLLVPATRALAGQHAAPPQNHVVKVNDADRDPQKWVWVPETVNARVGDTVIWDMTGAQVAHTATADDGSWDSGYIVPGAKWAHKFTAPGDYHYHCTPHPWKKGVIHVTP